MDVVIFGTGQISRLAWHQLSHDSPHRVVAFTVDSAYRTEPTFCGLPVEAFETLAERLPPERFAMLVPLSYRELSRVRREKYLAAKALGYRFVTYVASGARVDASAELGENCYIDTGAIIQGFSRLGDNCVVRAGAIVGHDVVLGCHCFVSSGAVIGGGTTIGDGCVVALNSTVLNGLKVADACMIGAGAVLTADAGESGTYLGVPARRVRP